MTDTTFTVPDLHCEHCKATVEGELNELAGVNHSSADPEKGAVEVSYNEAQVTAERLKETISNAGYTVTS